MASQLPAPVHVINNTEGANHIACLLSLTMKKRFTKQHSTRSPSTTPPITWCRPMHTMQRRGGTCWATMCFCSDSTLCARHSMQLVESSATTQRAVQPLEHSTTNTARTVTASAKTRRSIPSAVTGRSLSTSSAIDTLPVKECKINTRTSQCQCLHSATTSNPQRNNTRIGVHACNSISLDWTRSQDEGVGGRCIQGVCTGLSHNQSQMVVHTMLLHTKARNYLIKLHRITPASRGHGADDGGSVSTVPGQQANHLAYLNVACSHINNCVHPLHQRNRPCGSSTQPESRSWAKRSR